VRTLPQLAVATLILTLLFAPRPAHAEDDRVTELERKVDVLTREIEDLKLGAAGVDTAASRPRTGLGLAPAAAKVYGINRGVSIGGYGEMLYENFDRRLEDDSESDAIDQIDLLRNIVYVGFKFDDRLLFNSEIEVEHAVVAGDAGGEVAIEFAYLEWALQREFGLRAGMVLLPVGLVNELHEPPVFLGARRPEVEQVIIPTTWRGNGAGVFGVLANRLAYRAYVTEGLHAEGFTAEEGIREGRQEGAESRAVKPGFSARADWVGVSGMLAGASVYTGDSWQDFQPTDSTLSPRVTLFDVHTRWQFEGLDVRGLYAWGSLSDADELSNHLGLVGSSRLGEHFMGGYVEGAYNVMPLIAPQSKLGLSPYLRFETYDTQNDVPGGSEDPALERRVVTAGAAFNPHPNLVLKADRQWRTNEAETGLSQWNVQVGYLY
jgi:hypothetical protein